MLKIIPLGEIGSSVTKNMFAYETQAEILLVDCGIGFPDESMYGVDVLIPDITYLEKSRKKIVGMLLTHGHDDHIAGLPYILPKLPEFPIFASKLTAGFAKERLKDFAIEKQINIFDDQRGIRLGSFSIESVSMTHSVPDSRHFLISTPSVNIYHGSDFKLDLTPVDGICPDFRKIAEFGRRGVDLLLSDCLRSERDGFSLSESSIGGEIAAEIRNSRKKVIVTVMSSNVHRIQQVLNAAVSARRKVAFFGRSIEQSTRISQELGFLKIPNQSVVKGNKIHKIPDEEICLIVAGSQGQSGSALVRSAQGEHRDIDIMPGDKVIFSADPIPGHEHPVYETVDTLSRKGAEVIYVETNDKLHVSGHGSSGDLMLLIELLKPKFLVPIGGNFRHMVQYRKLAQKMGYKKESVFLLHEGQTMVIDDNLQVDVSETIQLRNVMVDGLGIGDVGKVVLRDRQVMAEEGMLVIILPLDQHTGEVTSEIEVISRGVVYVKQSKDLMEKTKQTVRSSIQDIPLPITDWTTIKEKIKTSVETLYSRELGRFPIIIPIIMRM